MIFPQRAHARHVYKKKKLQNTIFIIFFAPLPPAFLHSLGSELCGAYAAGFPPPHTHLPSIHAGWRRGLEPPSLSLSLTVCLHLNSRDALVDTCSGGNDNKPTNKQTKKVFSVLTSFFQKDDGFI